MRDEVWKKREKGADVLLKQVIGCRVPFEGLFKHGQWISSVPAGAVPQNSG